MSPSPHARKRPALYAGTVSAFIQTDLREIPPWRTNGYDDEREAVAVNRAPQIPPNEDELGPFIFAGVGGKHVHSHVVDLFFSMGDRTPRNHETNKQANPRNPQETRPQVMPPAKLQHPPVGAALSLIQPQPPWSYSDASAGRGPASEAPGALRSGPIWGGRGEPVRETRCESIARFLSPSHDTHMPAMCIRDIQPQRTTRGRGRGIGGVDIKSRSCCHSPREEQSSSSLSPSLS